MTLSGAVILLCVCTVAHAFDGGRGHGCGNKIWRHELLSQLPAEKAMSFHQTVREHRENGPEMQSLIKQLRG